MNDILNSLKNNAVLYIVGLLLILAPVTLLSNKGFYFAEFKDEVKITLTAAEGEEVNDDTLNDFADLGHVSKIDSENNSVYFQNNNKSDLKEDIFELDTENEDITVETIEIKDTKDLGSIVGNSLNLIIVLSLVSFVITSIFFLQRFGRNKTNYLLILNLLTIFIPSLILGFVLQYSFTSLISRWYQVKDFDISSVVITAVIIIFTFIYFYINQINKSSFNFTKLVNNIESGLMKRSASIILIASFLIVPILFALSSNFVLSGLLILNAIMAGLSSQLTIAKIINFFITPIQKENNEVEATVTKSQNRFTRSWKRNVKKRNK